MILIKLVSVAQNFSLLQMYFITPQATHNLVPRKVKENNKQLKLNFPDSPRWYSP